MAKAVAIGEGFKLVNQPLGVNPAQGVIIASDFTLIDHLAFRQRQHQSGRAPSCRSAPRTAAAAPIHEVHGAA
jgi:hypothetical protein